MSSLIPGHLNLIYMKNNLQLYIGTQKADLDSSTSVSIIYNLSNLSNPTDVTGSYSLTISLAGTKNNNKIFANYWKLDRLVAEHTGKVSEGVKFNPSKRVDATLYQNGDVLLNGYIQLVGISRVKNKINYDVSLYSQECDFFQNLKVKEDGTTKTLADLRWFIKDSNGEVLPEKTEWNFKIDKDIVSKAYLKEWDDDNDQLTDFLTFIPSYNGLYEDFDNESVLINTNGDNIFPKTYTDEGTEYSTQDGYLLGKLNKEYTEWETRDLRSYKQRPAIKLNKLINTIIRKENSGYDVELDSEFFNSSNPYWTDSFVAFPLLGSNNQSNDENRVTGEISKGSGDWTLNVSKYSINGNIVNSLSDVTQYPYNASTQVELDVSLELNSNSSAKELYLMSSEGGIWPYGGSICSQLVAYNERNEIVGYSPLYNFTNDLLLFGSYFINDPYKDNPKFNPVVQNPSIQPMLGKFVKGVNNYQFIQYNTGSNVFRFTLQTTKQAQTVSLKLYSWWSCYKDFTDPGTCFTRTVKAVNTSVKGCSATNEWINSSVSVNWYSNVVSGSLITKDLFLRNEKSCCDYLLSFTKLFGLYFITDPKAKKIKIATRKTFFTGEIVDLEDKIDYSKDLTITPLLFDKKYYRMKLEFPETRNYKQYKSQYDQTYGQQRIDTGYNFNSETKDLYENNIYQGSIPVLGTSKYYRNFYNQSTELIPCYLIDNMDVTYYNGNDSVDTTLYGYRNYKSYTEFSTTPGNDLFAKQEFVSEDNSLADITNSLVLYNGRVILADSKNNPVRYWVTDDLVEMGTLDDNQNCWLYPGNGTDSEGRDIAIRLYELPQYISLQIDQSGNVSSSLDIGYPKAIYLNAKYSEDKTLYSQYWKSFYNDQLNVNTRKINCFVKLDFANQEMLRKFYWFDNSYWIINKIDYSPTSEQTTSVEFIKVSDRNNYR